MRVDLRSTTVDDDDADAGVAQEHDVFGECLAQRLVGHGMAAVLHHDRAAVEAFQPRQCLDESGGFGMRVGQPGHVEYVEFSCT
jgi:hypothetical protein